MNTNIGTWEEDKNTSSNFLERITYPGITAEVLPGQEKIYEVVWNCGGLSVLISSLQNEKTKQAALQQLINIFESVKEKNDEVILVTDQSFLNASQDILQSVGENIFGKGNIAFVGVEKKSAEKHPISGLQINRSGFSCENRLLETLKALPDATVLSSIPFSDPRIHNEIQEKLELDNLTKTIAGKSLQILDLNSQKSNQLKIPGVEKMNNFLGIANNVEELESIFKEYGEQPLVIKDDNGAAGGTSINFIGNQKQQEAVLSKLQAENFPQVVYGFMEPTFIHNKDGGKFPTQFRPFLGSNGKFLGGTLKLPAKPVNSEKMFGTSAGKKAFDTQNKALNSSSGQTHSIFLAPDGKPASGFIFNNGYTVLDSDETNNFLKDFSFSNGVNVSGEEVIAISEKIFPHIRKIQKETNRLLDI